MPKRSKFQQQVIKNYYQNREAIALQRIGELVTELYLAEGKKLQQHWKNVASHLQKLDVPQSQIDHLVKQAKPELVADLVKRLMDKQ